MTRVGNESDLLSFETQPWAELFDELSDISEGAMSIPPLAIVEEDKEKRQSGKASRKGKEKEEIIETKGGGVTSNHGGHKWTERERRKKMKTKFSILHSLLPELSHKANSSTILEEAISEIKRLESTLQMLEKKKLERSMATKVSYINDDNINNNNNSNNNNANNLVRAGTVSPVMMTTWKSSNVVLSICGNDAQFTVYAVKKPGLLTNLCSVLEKYQIEVDASHISSHADQCIYVFHAHARNDQVGNVNCDQVPKPVNVAEIYKRAAEEMIKEVSS